MKCAKGFRVKFKKGRRLGSMGSGALSEIRALFREPPASDAGRSKIHRKFMTPRL